ncbi:MAG: hypothetical protein HOP13_15265 [Alphaproteobacteria bacterium]|nr:hypothetical protein [Alphaproteobacteria bacterium]
MLLGAIGAVTLFVWLVVGSVVWPDIPPRPGDVFGFVWRLFLLPAPFSGPEEAKAYWAAAFIREWPVGYRLLSGVCALVTTGIVGVILVTLRRRFALK